MDKKEELKSILMTMDKMHNRSMWKGIFKTNEIYLWDIVVANSHDQYPALLYLGTKGLIHEFSEYNTDVTQYFRDKDIVSAQKYKPDKKDLDKGES